MSEEKKLSEPKKPKASSHIYFVVYDPQIEQTEFFKSLTSLENTTAFPNPYILEDYSLRPVVDGETVRLSLRRDEKTSLGVVTRLFEINRESLEKNQQIYDYFNGLKEDGDLKETQEPDFKYLYKLEVYRTKDVFSLSRNNSIFSTQNIIDKEGVKSKIGTLVETYFSYYAEKFSRPVALNSLNYLENNLEKALEGPTNFVQSFIADILREDSVDYIFERGSMEKIEYNVEVEKYIKGNLLLAPQLKPETGNFDWDKTKEFLKSYSDNKGKHDIAIGD